MKVAVDKTTAYIVDVPEYDCEYIYLFKDEGIDELLATNLHCLRYDLCDYVDINLTDFEIECRKKAKPSEPDFLELPPWKDFKIGIIIPNCNYGEYLEKSVGSCLSQTYKNIQVVLVDDMSTDNSVEIAKKMLKPPHKLVQLKQKRYNGGARNEAYLHLDDDVDYVYYVDSDDWLYDEHVIEKINQKLQSRPDVLFVAMDAFKDGQQKRVFTPNYKDKYQAIEGWSGSCGKVIKKELATRQECLYNEGTLKEDRNQHCRICIYMKDFKLMKEPVYVWNQSNKKSVTTIREKVFWGTSTIRHYADTLQLYLSEKGKDDKIDKYLKSRVEQTKSEVLNGGDKQW